ncbi:hypothetical protein [Roseinatronobacter monicus]|uniref:hypothetical protein n=1 Tax=Roseinatronobacter monicus TaxID=393481 RepID=UPI003F2FCE52
MSTVAPKMVTAEPATSFAAHDVEFLNLMGNLEGPRGFGTVTDFAPALPARPLTEMTLAEVLVYQRDIRCDRHHLVSGRALSVHLSDPARSGRNA